MQDALPEQVPWSFSSVHGVVGCGGGPGPMPRPAPPRPDRPAAVVPKEDIVPGQSYAALRLRRHGPSSRVTSDLARLRRGFPAVSDPVERDPATRGASLARRAESRAYDGAPPTIPHAVDQTSAGACLACHGEGLLVDGHLAPRISHEPFASCTQCHVGASGPPGSVATAVDNGFEGLGSPGTGGRAWPGAPPTIPHGTWLRDDCASCHGVTGWPGLRTTHPDRHQCVQCHAPSGGAPPWAEGA